MALHYWSTFLADENTTNLFFKHIIKWKARFTSSLCSRYETIPLLKKRAQIQEKYDKCRTNNETIVVNVFLYQKLTFPQPVNLT